MHFKMGAWTGPVLIFEVPEVVIVKARSNQHRHIKQYKFDHSSCLDKNVDGSH